VDRDDPSLWWCLHTKPRQEKATARFLRDLGLSYFLPMTTKESRTPGGRKIRSTVPLFPNYLFLRGDRRARLEAFQGDTLANALDVPDQACLDNDLRQIHRILTSGLLVEPAPDFPTGTRIRISSGPLQGSVGTIIRRGNSDHFISIVHFLGRGALVEVQGWQIERFIG
jgi:transcriptional antiterminator RfaH